MKTFLIITLSICITSQAQVTDTIFTNEHHNVAIFFPDHIRQAIVGADNFVFSYNQEHPQLFGLLKGSTGKSSNLLAITSDGTIYSYIIAYRDELPGMVYFLDQKASLGNENRNIANSFTRPLPKHKDRVEVDRTRDSVRMGNWARHFLLTAQGPIKRKKRAGITLFINKVIFKGGEFYTVLEIVNDSSVDFETEYLKFFVTQGNKRRNSSYQKIFQPPLLEYNFPKIIRSGDRKRFVHVLPKFTLGEKEYMQIELREKNGSRSVKMNLKQVR